MKKIFYSLLTFTLMITACTDTQKYYTVDDFASVDKIDAHVHIWTNDNDLVNQATLDNFKAITVMVDYGGHENVEAQYKYSLHHLAESPDKVQYIATFEIEGLDEPDWLENTIAKIDEHMEAGAIGVKVWKNIGMVYRDKDGNLVMIDDPRIDPVFKYLAEKKIPVLGHLGEPKNCWLPLEEMTTNNDRNYFTKNPEYHMYLHPEFPSYDDQIAARDNMLENNPDLIFIGAHLGSLEWDLDELALRLDKFPNMAVDLAERMGQLFDQTSSDPDKVRNFFIKYQDRLLYATDRIDEGEESNAADFNETLHAMWEFDWKYFVSDEDMSSHLINKGFKGIKLPKTVIDKLYYENAKKWYGVF